MKEMTSEEAREHIIKYHVGREPCMDVCEGDCDCDYEKRTPALVTFKQYIEPIRIEAEKLIEEGYFEKVILYKPTQKAFDKQKELKQ